MEPTNQLGYAKYACKETFPLHCRYSNNITAKVCEFCNFPAVLPPGIRLQAERQGYEVQVKDFLKPRGNGWLYRGRRLDSGQPVILKEYLLPLRYFTRSRARACRENFRQVATLELADGRSPEFRLLVPDDICIQPDRPEESTPPSFGRCYQILSGERGADPSLRDYLASHNGRLPAERVRWILARVLQSAICLHEQKFRLRSGAVRRGLEHGNLTLETLLVDSLSAPALVYLSDLALWERQFDPQARPESAEAGGGAVSPARTAPVAPERDLHALGRVAIALLEGEANDAHLSGEVRSAQPHLARVIDRLLGGEAAFASARDAAESLREVPVAPAAIALPPPEPLPAPPRPRRLWPLAIATVLLAAVGVGLGVLAWQWGRQRAAAEPDLCCFDRVEPIPPRALYVGAADGVWADIFKRDSVATPGQSLREFLESSRPGLQGWCYQTYPLAPLPGRGSCASYALAPERINDKSLADLARSGAIDFGILPPGALAFDPEQAAIPFARDGVVVFVAFNSPEREDGLTYHLRGQISFEQLRQLYTGRVERWNQLDPQLPDIPVQLYAPRDETAIASFESVIFRERAADAAEFRRRLGRSADSDPDLSPASGPDAIARSGPTIVQLPTTLLLRQTIADFEDRTPPVGSIGFESLARVFDQCAIYPLALAGEASPPISPLVRNDGTAISPRTDLCQSKGEFRPNHAAIATQRYPLSYPLAVVYRRDNRRPDAGRTFARLLTTVQGQCLLQNAGLTPLTPETLSCNADE